MQHLDGCEVDFKSYAESLLDTDNELSAHMVFGVTSYYTQQEALRISDRTKAGLEQARRNRRKVLGKPEGFEKRAPTLAQMKEEHWSQERMRRGTGLSYSTVMRYLKRLEAQGYDSMPNLEAVKGQIRFFLGEVSARNEHHSFERLCEEVAKARICTNIVPPTGPVSAGGDQGRDLETFKSYLEKSDISDSAFLGLVSEGVLVFAFSTEKNSTKSKIRSDVEKIMASGETSERIYFFSTDDIPVGRRHSFQQDIWQDHAVRLEIFDKHWLAEHLSAPDLYWAAEK